MIEKLCGMGSPQEFWDTLAHAGRGVLCLDYDGTLAPFHVDPDAVTPYPGVAPLLERIRQTGHTRLVVVTGREIRRHFPLPGLDPHVEVWGSHGRERRLPDGQYAVAGISDESLQCLVEVDSWSPLIEAAGGRCEQKPGMMAIHWRGLPQERAAAIRETVVGLWGATEMGLCLDWLDFDGGIELRAPGADKALAVATVLREEHPGVPAAFLGDDITDESAFKLLRGRGFTGLVRPRFRPTAADYWISPPEGLMQFLSGWYRALEYVR